MKSSAALSSQLRRMRAMNYRYHALFFRYINFCNCLPGQTPRAQGVNRTKVGLQLGDEWCMVGL